MEIKNNHAISRKLKNLYILDIFPQIEILNFLQDILLWVPLKSKFHVDFEYINYKQKL